MLLGMSSVAVLFHFSCKHFLTLTKATTRILGIADLFVGCHTFCNSNSKIQVLRFTPMPNALAWVSCWVASNSTFMSRTHNFQNSQTMKYKSVHYMTLILALLFTMNTRNLDFHIDNVHSTPTDPHPHPHMWLQLHYQSLSLNHGPHAHPSPLSLPSMSLRPMLLRSSINQRQIPRTAH